MKINMTEEAVKEIKRVREELDMPFFRIGLGAGGCSGFKYKLQFDDNYDEAADSQFEVDGLTVVIDKKSAIYLDGATLMYQDTIEGRGFHFENPNAVKSCGCGSSFGV